MVDLTGFSVLETKILETENEDNIQLYEKFDSFQTNQVYNFGEVLKYTLAASAILDQQGMLDNYFHIGGGATLLHIANTIGIENIDKWRGTHDMDIVVTNYGVRGTLESFFPKYEEYNSASIENKKKIEIKDPQAQDSVQIDLYFPNHKNKINIDGYQVPKRIINELKTIKILGIKAKVPKLHDLIAMKLKVSTKNTQLPRKKDMEDIKNLIGCIEKNQGIKERYNTNKKLAKYLYNKLNGTSNKLPKRLYDVINYSKQNQLDYIITAPSLNLINEYKYYYEEMEEEKKKKKENEKRIFNCN